MDRLNLFDFSLKQTAGKEIKLTDFVSRNPTKNPEPEQKYQEEFVINAIAAKLATVNVCIARTFNQSDCANAVNKANMHGMARAR